MAIAIRCGASRSASGYLYPWQSLPWPELSPELGQMLFQVCGPGFEGIDDPMWLSAARSWSGQLLWSQRAGHPQRFIDPLQANFRYPSPGTLSVKTGKLWVVLFKKAGEPITVHLCTDVPQQVGYGPFRSVVTYLRGHITYTFFVRFSRALETVYYRLAAVLN